MEAKKKQDSLEAIRWPMTAIKQEEARLRSYIQLARNDGASWTEIGKVMGVTRQAAQKRFGKVQGVPVQAGHEAADRGA